MTDLAPATSLTAPPVLTSAEEAVETARGLADRLRPGAVEREQGLVKPLAELDWIAGSGLLSITVPRAFGGPDLPRAAVVEAFRVLAVADPAIAQLLLSHFVLQQTLRDLGSPETQELLFAAVLRGERIGNAVAERGTKHVFDRRTTIRPTPAGHWQVDGRKFYATGALGAQWIGVVGNVAEGHPAVAFVRPDDAGVTLDLDDWSAFGQRGTFSGTVLLEAVEVPAERVIDIGELPAEIPPVIEGAWDQALHTAIDVGIARAALEDGAEFVRSRSRVWFEAGVERAAEEPYVIQRFGRLTLGVHAAEALLERGARLVDDALAAPALTDESTAAASLAVAEAKALAAEVSVETASAILELAGTSAADARHGLDRHWRNARVHTLHDPARWKLHHIGNHTLNGVRPPRHPLI